MNKIVPIIKRGASSDYHRLYQPLKYLGINLDTNEKLPVLLKDAEVVIFNRWAGFEIEHLLRFKKQYGFKIICDLDDYFELYPKHYLYRTWEANDTKRKIIEALFNSDFVFTATKKLADVALKFNKKVEVIPNGLPFDKEQFTTNKMKSDKFEIVYVGGQSHYWDLLSLKNLFFKISRENIKKNIAVSVAGYSDKTPEAKKFWDVMENIMTAQKRLELRRRTGRPIESYMDLYDGASLAIAPLEFNYFNACKSNLKILEAGCKQIPIITSDVSPYSDEPTDLFIKAASVNEWYTSIKLLSERPEYAEQLGYKLGEYVRKNYQLEDINEKRKQIFEYLCN